MVFSSPEFMFLFLAVTVPLYYIVPKYAKNAVLLISSLIFYAWGEPVYVLLMMFSIGMNYFAGRMIGHFEGGRGAKAALVVSIVLNVAMFGVFKYSGFVIENLNLIPGISIPVPGIKLPIGISFYTFQTMSYVIDVYRKDARVQKNIVSFGAYVALFPQLIAGPIVRYQTIADQLDVRTHSFDKFGSGVARFMCGMMKKMVLANGIATVFDALSVSDSKTVLGAWLCVAAYTFQIYFDFSGYSDMAIGLGRMLGFDFLENFDHPYISRSITEFWRRWHMSLGTWFRDYVYIPLGGNRLGYKRQLFNITVVWLLTGLWHGASWNFVLWGAFYAVLLICEKLFLLKFLDRIPKVFGHIYAMLFVMIGWAIFAFDIVSAGVGMIGRMFGAGVTAFADSTALYYLKGSLPLIIIMIIASTPLAARAGERITKKNPKTAAVLQTVLIAAALIVSTAYIVGGTYNPFLYFRF